MLPVATCLHGSLAHCFRLRFSTPRARGVHVLCLRALFPSVRIILLGGAGKAAAGAAEEPDIEGLAGFWQCATCTFANQNMTATDCEMCGQPRSAAPPR